MTDLLSVFELRVSVVLFCGCAWELLRYAELRTAGAGVARNLLFRGQNGLACDDLEYRHMSADADGQFGRAGATLRVFEEHVLHDAVLQRVIADHRDATPGASQRIADSKPERSTSSSEFTSIRSA